MNLNEIPDAVHNALETVDTNIVNGYFPVDDNACRVINLAVHNMRNVPTCFTPPTEWNDLINALENLALVSHNDWISVEKWINLAIFNYRKLSTYLEIKS